MSYSLTLGAVSDIKINETILSLRNSMEVMEFKEVILLTSKSIDKRKIFKGLKIIKIKPLESIKDYSNFIIYELYKYINTSHILIVQWDGFIINPTKWDSSFLSFDYIGAPFIPRVNDKNYSKDQNNNFYSVGNGGFTLRSRTLLEAPSKFNLRDNQQYTSNHEDGFFCVYHREFLESKGFKWAPFITAKNFAIESIISINDIIDLPFGFHGKKILKSKQLIFLINYIFNLIKRYKSI